LDVARERIQGLQRSFDIELRPAGDTKTRTVGQLLGVARGDFYHRVAPGLASLVPGINHDQMPFPVAEEKRAEAVGEQGGTQPGQLRFAPDEVYVRPGEIAAQGAVQCEQSQALRDVLGELPQFGTRRRIKEVAVGVMPPLVALDVEALKQVTLPTTEQSSIHRRVEVSQFHKPERRGTLTHEAVFEFVPAPFLPFPAAGIAAQVGAGEAGDKELRVTQCQMAADLPVVEVLDVLLVEKDFQIAVEAAAENSFQLRMQPSDQRGPRFAGGVVTLMRIREEEEVVSHDGRSYPVGGEFVNSNANRVARAVLLRIRSVISFNASAIYSSCRST